MSELKGLFSNLSISNHFQIENGEFEFWIIYLNIPISSEENVCLMQYVLRIERLEIICLYIQYKFAQ